MPPNPNAPIVSGMLDVSDKGTGYLRSEARKFKPVPADPVVPSDMITRAMLRPGVMVTGTIFPPRQGSAPQLSYITQVNGKSLAEYQQMLPYADLTVIDPREKIQLETPGGPATMRIMDLMTPIGRGQRGLIVAPPKTGKTTLLKEIGQAVLANHPDMKVFILLVDERPEEVTDFRRSMAAEVWASNSDEDAGSHVRTARIVIERAKRMVEENKHVLVILDSITRLARAFNTFAGNSGRTMSGGVDAAAMQEPRGMFGAARNIENGGSLTIIASALIDTGSRMDELIFQEFKGTGNMELVLSKKLAEKRIWPAIDIPASGTRKEELLFAPGTVEKMYLLRRSLLQRDPVSAMESMLNAMKKFPTNAQFLAGFTPSQE